MVALDTTAVADAFEGARPIITKSKRETLAFS